MFRASHNEHGAKNKESMARTRKKTRLNPKKHEELKKKDAARKRKARMLKKVRNPLPQMRGALDKNGYVILPASTDTKVAARLLKKLILKVPCSEYSPIFNKEYDTMYNSRKTAPLTAESFQTPFKVFEEMARCKLGAVKFEFTGHVAVRSETRCEMQRFHCDYDSISLSQGLLGETQCHPSAMSCSVIVCVEEESELLIVPGSHGRLFSEVKECWRADTQPVTATLRLGEMIVMRGDFLHAGAANNSDRRTYRAFFYAVTPALGASWKLAKLTNTFELLSGGIPNVVNDRLRASLARIASNA